MAEQRKEAMDFRDDNKAWKEFLTQNLRAIGAATGRDDVAAALALFAPDVVYRGNGWKGYRNVDVKGLKALGDMIWAIVVEYEVISIDVRDPIVDGDRMAFDRVITLRSRGTGRAADISVCAFVRFHQGLIVEVTEMFDTLAIDSLNDQ
jgi:ketosteroid isomerase-like protein